MPAQAAPIDNRHDKVVRKFVTIYIFKTVLNDIFNSKLIYGITVYGGVWGLPGGLNDDPVNATPITKEDMRKLQVLQNVALRLLLGKPRDTPVTSLLSEAKQLSVHQLVAFHMAAQTFKIYSNKEPTYHYSRLFGNNPNNVRSTTNIECGIDINLTLGRNTFFYQAAHIWKLLPLNMKTSVNI